MPTQLPGWKDFPTEIIIQATNVIHFLLGVMDGMKAVVAVGYGTLLRSSLFVVRD